VRRSLTLKRVGNGYSKRVEPDRYVDASRRNPSSRPEVGQNLGKGPLPTQSGHGLIRMRSDATDGLRDQLHRPVAIDLKPRAGGDLP
jgi:hypothetical protein